MHTLERRTFIKTSVGITAAAALGWTQDSPSITGPFVGHQEPGITYVWARVPGVSSCELVARTGGGREIKAKARPHKDNDWCVTWRLKGLKDSKKYTYKVLSGKKVLAKGGSYYFHTPPKEKSEGAYFGHWEPEHKSSSARPAGPDSPMVAGQVVPAGCR